MIKFLTIFFLIFILTLFISCNSDKPASVDDRDDKDISDTETIDEIADDKPDVSHVPDETPDENPDEVADVECLDLRVQENVINP